MCCARTDNVNQWDWAVFRDDSVFKEDGAAVAACRPYIPGSYDHPPRNIVDKMNSGYRAKEWQGYVYGLEPALPTGILPELYWKNLCKLVKGVQIIQQRTISQEQVIEAQQYLEEFHLEFEAIYVRRQANRIYFVRPWLYSAWTIECTVGNLGEEIKSHSRPYVNLTQCSLLRGQINAIEAKLSERQKVRQISLKVQ
ncbi:hypothetical protein M422DRAFT_250232 [Sphaerobolus stellatus SS14]|uniref:Uncharacterized protein n=1 Tax=Sphaerobolus stellatus (strain SS14) TaxID=990650 RepID=A0A0C9UTL9_SPHS4|nr:hypothetical protein M422DRAFT_250232 [Sphaerobolus stellatus SS14]